jgi:hypothetical protein
MMILRSDETRSELSAKHLRWVKNRAKKFARNRAAGDSHQEFWGYARDDMTEEIKE